MIQSNKHNRIILKSIMLTDIEILNLILSKDKKEVGYRYLIRKYQEKLYSFIKKMNLNHEDTDDILQNVFIKIIKNVDRFEQKSSLSTWIYKIATNETLNFISSKKRKATLEWNDDFSKSVTDGVNIEDTTLWLKEAIDLLPDKQKLVFNLRYYEEMPYHTISEITDTSEGALKASYHHAVKKIEIYLKGKVNI